MVKAVLNGMAMSFIERFYGYHHVSIPMAGKPFVVVICGALGLDNATDQMRRMLCEFDVNILDVVHFLSRVPPCLRCGRHHECEIGGLHEMLGDDALDLKVTKGMFHQW